ncbi:U-box domain-containing protein 6 [Ananas comosus]|uniref:RING-type E3 ubiquitin transferase n=1 Tax=Ananas comosus TaxID=4615 RepID=A0A199V5I2_ANACO|nr:U-box domain-containing protein 6 [Ananas comosus]
MDGAEVEEHLLAAGNWKLHGGMCKQLSGVVYKFLVIFPILEAAKPASKSGIQVLCSLHIALEKAKRLLQHCAECSKIYLAITGDSVLLKFQKARSVLLKSLQHVDEIASPSISCQIVEILSELEATEFTLDQLEKQAGDELIQLLQKDRKLNTTSIKNVELEIFHQAASKLGITSSRAALTERRALKKLIEKAHAEEDKKKESIVAYLLHLMKKYSKLFRTEASDDTDSQGSSPRSPTLNLFNENGQAFERQLSKLGSFNSKQNEVLSGSFPIPPEELRCPISLQLMYDPVIISSGQTYERACIEKWFNDGHRTCPKTQQELSHLSLTPNYCLKSLITSWCEQNGVPIPDGPPASLDFNYWNLASTESEATDSRSVESNGSFHSADMKVVPFDKVGDANLENGSFKKCGADGRESYERSASVLSESGSLAEQRKAVEEIRARLKDDEEARICMGANGFAAKLVRFLEKAICELDEKAQEVGAMALFNLAVNNNSNKKGYYMRSDPLLEEMIAKPKASEAATALYFNLSCLDEARPTIGLSRAVPFLIQFLKEKNNSQSRTRQLDALYTLYNLSAVASNIPTLISAGIIKNLHSLLGAGYPLVDKSLAIFINIALKPIGRKEMIATPGLIGSIAAILDAGELAEREQAAACLWVLCDEDEDCIHHVLQEGVIPALVLLAANGTQKGKDRAQKLLSLFREQRQRKLSPGRVQLHEFDKAEFGFDEPPPRRAEVADGRGCLPEVKHLSKSRSRRLGRALTSIWKHGNFSRCRHD